MCDEKIGKVFGDAAVAAVAALSSGLAQAVATSAEFERQINAIGIVERASKRQMRSIRKKALRLGQETAFSAQQAAKGMEELLKAGVTIAEIMEDASRATEISVEEFEAAEDDDD